jgi:two-component system chemotaxis sensor kinase CheA
VALILNVAGLAAKSGVGSRTVADGPAADSAVVAGTDSDGGQWLMFHNSPEEPCALPLEYVVRVERVGERLIQHLGGKRTMVYRGGALPALSLSDAAGVEPINGGAARLIVVLQHGGREWGLLAAEPVEVVPSAPDMDLVTLRQNGILGSAVIRGRNTLLVDVAGLVDTVYPEWRERQAHAAPQAGGPMALVAEDSDFFRHQVRRLMERVGCQVLEAPDGEAAWQLLQCHAGEVKLVATDIEMPRLDGLGLTRKIRADGRFEGLPVIALTALADRDEEARGKSAGVDVYHVKLNEQQFLDSVQQQLERAGRAIREA